MTAQEYAFTDLHTHILPGVDDGARDLEQAMTMLGMAVEDGTRRIVLTPHYRGSCRPDRQLLLDRFRPLQEQARQKFPELELFLGCEISFFHEAEAMLRQEQLLTIGAGSCVLLEFSPEVYRTQLLFGLRSVRDAGFQPVLAHAERYRLMTPELARELVGQGVLLQLNADSVLGTLGLRTKWLCRKLLRQRLVFCIASDAHDVSDRPPLLKKCYGYIRKKYGSNCADALFSHNPASLLR